MTEGVDETVLVRRVRDGRLRQLAIAGVSVLVAAIAILVLSPEMVGGFAFYSIIGLLVLNAFFALRQSHIIIEPVETMLRRMLDIEHAVDDNRYSAEHLYSRTDDAFACLAAGMDHLVEKLIEKARVSNERCLQHIAVVQATPFTFFIVSPSGKVLALIKDHYNLFPFLQLVAGQVPSEKVWGKDNLARFLEKVKHAFSDSCTHWLDMPFPASGSQPEHSLRVSVMRLNDFSALVVMGDLPAIDKFVENATARAVQVDRIQKHAALKRFAASVAHDGRNVFTALNNLIALIKQSPDQNVREQTEAADEVISRGTNLMTELMQLAGETKYVFRCMSGKEAMQQLFTNSTVRALVPDNIALATDISDRPMPDIDIDPDQLWKISFNLVKNAVEAIGSLPGRIWLLAKPYTMTDEKSKTFRSTTTIRTGRGVLAIVSDDGSGIDPAILDKIFDPYASSKGEGRGLGLATAFSVIEAHNGAVRVLSRPSLGTTFEIFLPASRHAAEELEMVKKIAPNGEILLTDDDPAILHTTSLVLQALKIAAHPSATADDAVLKLRLFRTRINAVIVDAHLSGAARLLRTIRKEYPHMPIILASGTPESSVRDIIVPSLYDRFLEKPYSVAELKKALGNVS